MSERRPADLAAGLSPEQRRELGDLTSLQRRLAGYVAPTPSPEATERLLAQLRPLLAAQTAAVDSQGAEETLPAPPDTAMERLPAVTVRASAGASLGHLLRLAWWQTSLLEPGFWWAYGLVFLLALLLAVGDRSGRLPLLLALAAPLLATAAVAYAFRADARSTWELERVAPIQPMELLYARLAMVLSGNLVLALLLVGVVSAANPQLVLWRMALLWLGPMLALAGVALYATVRWGAIVGAAVPMLTWSGAVLLAWRSAGIANAPLDVFMLTQVLPVISRSNSALTGALLAVGAGVLLLVLAGRLLGEEGALWS